MTGDGPDRRGALLRTTTVLLIVVAAGLLPIGGGADRPTPIVPPAGVVDLAPGEAVETDWILVPDGMQARWEWHGGVYMDFTLVARGIGYLDGGDTGGGRGCVRADPAFEIRLWLGNTAFPPSTQTAHVTYSIVLENASSAPCDSVIAVHNGRGSQLLGTPNMDDGPPPIVVAAGVAVPVFAGVVAFLVVAAYAPVSKPAPPAGAKQPEAKPADATAPSGDAGHE